MRSPIQTTYDDLPQDLPIFPLPGAILMPWGRLPLNVFEPRYLNMTLDALKNGRIIGMIQPDLDQGAEDGAESGEPSEPPLYKVGCVGRIAAFEETEDGRLLITLKGLIRFHVKEELEGRRGYRRIRPSYESFRSDMNTPEKFELNREGLMSKLKAYLETQSIPINLEIIKGLSDATLVMSLCMICPFDPREKQALLEAATMRARADTLLALLQMGAFESSAPEGPRQ